MKSRAPPVVTRVRNTGNGGGFRQGQKASIPPLLFIAEIEVEPLYGDTGSILGCFHRTCKRLAMGFDLAMELLWLVSMVILPRQDGSFFFFSFFILMKR